jgi:hypothetical protein
LEKDYQITPIQKEKILREDLIKLIKENKNKFIKYA